VPGRQLLIIGCNDYQIATIHFQIAKRMSKFSARSRPRATYQGAAEIREFARFLAQMCQNRVVL